MRVSLALGTLAASLLLATPTSASESIPTCRLDDSLKTTVADVFQRAIAAFGEIGWKLPIEMVDVNPKSPPTNPKVLRIYIVHDAGESRAGVSGCPPAPVGAGERLDDVSVRGGCVVVAIESREIRCSSSAIRIFGETGRKDRTNPALLYVISHELAHLYQRRPGGYSGRPEHIELDKDQATKLQLLQDACDPVSTHREEEADEMSLRVLARLLVLPPYREPALTERGSLYSNIDQLALATNAWQQAAVAREFISQPAVHPSFVATEFPTPTPVIEENARRFVCEVLTKRNGTIFYPGKTGTHPPREHRLRRIAEEMGSIASRLPATGGHRDFQPIVKLRDDIGPILTKIYRETGVYLRAVQSNICTIVNGPDPQSLCR